MVVLIFLSLGGQVIRKELTHRAKPERDKGFCIRVTVVRDLTRGSTGDGGTDF